MLDSHSCACVYRNYLLLWYDVLRPTTSKADLRNFHRVTDSSVAVCILRARNAAFASSSRQYVGDRNDFRQRFPQWIFAPDWRYASAHIILGVTVFMDGCCYWTHKSPSGSDDATNAIISPWTTARHGKFTTAAPDPDRSTLAIAPAGPKTRVHFTAMTLSLSLPKLLSSLTTATIFDPKHPRETCGAGLPKKQPAHSEMTPMFGKPCIR